MVEAVWPDAMGAGVSEQAIDALVRRLRDRLAKLDEEHKYVVTVRGAWLSAGQPAKCEMSMIYQDWIEDRALMEYAAGLNGRAGRLGAPGRLTAAQLRDRILASGGRCEWCGCDAVGDQFELDHIVSLRGGGQNIPGNLALACPDCNRRKARKHPARFAVEVMKRSGQRTPLVHKLLRAFDLGGGMQLSMFDGDAAGPALAEGGQEKRDLSQAHALPIYDWSEA